MGRYFTTVSFIKANNKAAEEINESLRVHNGTLVTTEESKNILIENIVEEIKWANARNAKCKKFGTSVIEGSDHGVCISISSGADGSMGTIWFKPVRQEA